MWTPGTIYLVLRLCRLLDVASGPQSGLVRPGLGRLSLHHQCLSCEWVCRSGHDATCVVTGRILTVRGTPSELEASEALLQPEGGNTLGSGVNTAGGSVAVLMANLLLSFG